MSGILSNIADLYRGPLERHRNRPFLRAAMAGCALASMADGDVSLQERVQVDRLLETLDALQVFDPHEAVDLFNGFVASLRASPEAGHREAFEAIDAEVAREPDKARLLVRICLAVSEREGGIPGPVLEEIRGLCGRLGLDPGACDLPGSRDG